MAITREVIEKKLVGKLLCVKSSSSTSGFDKEDTLIIKGYVGCTDYGYTLDLYSIPNNNILAVSFKENSLISLLKKNYYVSEYANIRWTIIC